MSKKVRVPIVALAALLLTAICVPLAGAAKDDTTLVSRQSAAGGGAGGDDSSVQASTSPDGRFVAFESDADNLSGEDDNDFTNVFLRDLETNTTTLVSRQSASNGGAAADGNSFEPSVSADGRFVAFDSNADNLSDADDDGIADIFVRDLQTNTTTLVSRQSGAGGPGGDSVSSRPSISDDGRRVAFDSGADNLSDDDDEISQDVFVRDLEANTTTLVSRQSGAGGPGGDDTAIDPSISADGRFVAFDSDATNLSDADSDTSQDVFVRDLAANTTTLASRRGGADGAGGDDSSFVPSISADGRRVAFASDATNLSDADDNAGIDDVFVRDLAANTTTLVSREDGGDGAVGDGASFDPSISADGRLVAFDSEATNLSAADVDPVFDIFVRDLAANTTTFVSRQTGAGGAGGGADSFLPSMSADGRFVAFESEAGNLSDADNDAVTDIFVRDVLGDGGGGGGGELTLELKAKKRQKAGKPVKVKATCSEDCALKARGRAKREGRKKLKFKRAEAELAADETQKLRLKPSKKVARKLRRAGKAKARITAKATDAAGNEASESVKVKLRRAGR